MFGSRRNVLFPKAQRGCEVHISLQRQIGGQNISGEKPYIYIYRYQKRRMCTRSYRIITIHLSRVTYYKRSLYTWNTAALHKQLLHYFILLLLYIFTWSALHEQTHGMKIQTQQPRTVCARWHNRGAAAAALYIFYIITIIIYAHTEPCAKGVDLLCTHMQYTYIHHTRMYHEKRFRWYYKWYNILLLYRYSYDRVEKNIATGSLEPL